MTRTSTHRPRVAAGILLGLTLGLFAWTAFATRDASDRAVTDQILAESAKPGGHAPAAGQALTEARKALRRADDARASGDTANAARLEGLAREWAELASDLSRAVRVEADADSAQAAAADAALQVRQARAMLEVLVARQARAQGELQASYAQSDAGLHPAALAAARAVAPSASSPPPTPRAPSSVGGGAR